MHFTPCIENIFLFFYIIKRFVKLNHAPQIDTDNSILITLLAFYELCFISLCVSILVIYIEFCAYLLKKQQQQAVAPLINIMCETNADVKFYKTIEYCKLF